MQTILFIYPAKFHFLYVLFKIKIEITNQIVILLIKNLTNIKYK